MSENQPEMPDVPRTWSAIPYYPELLDLVPTITCAVLVTYLEMRYPTPIEQETGLRSKRVSSLPVTVSAEQVCRDLRVSRRTLALSLYSISRVFPSEASRWAAVRAGREFITHHHKRNPHIKLYSLVSDVHLHLFKVLILRRNLNKVPRIPVTYSADNPRVHTSVAINAIPTGGFPPSPSHSDRTKPAGAPPLVSSPQTLADILLKASVLSGDRRSERYPRLRKAVASGLESPSVLSAKQPKRKTTLNDAVQPDLPDEVANRLARTK